MIDERTYNRFARALADHIRYRAKGLDDDSARIVNSRPQEHILSGFLTPRSPDQRPHDAADEDAETDDLPHDSAFELTAIGLEFMVDREALTQTEAMPLTVGLNVYIRCIPTFAEQQESPAWRRERVPGQDNIRKVQSLLPVWQRFAIAPFTIALQVPEFLRERRARIDISSNLRPSTTDIQSVAVHTARHAIDLTEHDCATETAFDAAAARARAQPFTPFWRAFVDARLINVPTEPGVARIAVRVVNDTPPPAKAQTEYLDANLYAVRSTVSVPRAAHRPTIFQELPASFRYDRTMPGVGINSQVDATSSASIIDLTAESVPITETSRLEAREFKDADPTFSGLASQPIPILESIARHMDAYDANQWQSKIQALAGLERTEAKASREEFQQEIDRFKRGVALLKDATFPLVLQAFLLMNNAMGAANKAHARWRLFQIAFIVSLLPELASREYPALATDQDGFVDLLWFAAGGGKTEAFMGIILWQAFFDRLRGKRFGNSAFVRFPLRLLTFQQLQRLARALSAAEVVRKACGLKGARFSIGYLVGGTVTPNSISDELHRRYCKQGVDLKYQRIFKCPFCDGPVSLSYEPVLRLIEHHCANSQCAASGERLPIYVTDQDIYRFLPTVIVSTVDKLALLGQNHRFSNLFGRIDLICGKHGATFSKANELCEAAAALGRGERPPTCAGAPVYYGPFHDLAPAILVQDELHLLNEELGTFDAHYETGVIALFKSLGAKPWKIIGATATIQEFDRQAWELYLRGARQFPAHGPDADDSFYYRQNPDKCGRIFVGLLGVGRKHTPAVTKALSIFYREMQTARELAAQDPAKAASIFGIGQLTASEQKDLFFLYELALTYVLTRKGSDQVAEAIESRVRRELQENCPQHGDLLLEMFNGGVDVSHMIAAMDELKAMTSTGDPSTRTRGVVTTNIIGHGVDVDRFNVIVFAGFTRLVAEYIQASARVGRKYPGISVFVPTPQSERDRSIFGRFAKFHQYLDRLVDPAAVTRWPEPAMRRTLPGLLCGYLMGVASQALGRPLATVEAVRDSQGNANAAALAQDAIVDWMVKAYGCEHAPSPQYREKLVRGVKNAFSSIVNMPAQRGRFHALNMHLEAMNSLRDVDEPAFIRVGNSEEAKALQRLIDG
ncbi:MAG: DEAD/DEAH box helicase family protein [Bryobacteraceae bacterium]